MFEGSWLEALHQGLAESEAQAYLDAVSILDSMIPDNANFTTDDASDWERRLGMITNSSTPLEDRKAAILRKMAYPGVNPARSHYLYLERQLQLAGFDVYVHENIPAQSPGAVNAAILGHAQYNTFNYGGFNYGGYVNAIVANQIDAEQDLAFNVGDNQRCTFFIGGQVLGTYANVSASRETEFRQMILKLKPVQNIAYLFITYV